MSTEVLLVALVMLLIVASVVVVGIKAIKYVQTSNLMSGVSQLVVEIQATYDGNYSALDQAGAYLLAPDSIKGAAEGQLKSKFGDITVAKVGEGQSFTVTLTGIPQDVCIKMANFAKDSAKSRSIGTTTVDNEGQSTTTSEAFGNLMTQCVGGDKTLVYTFN